MMLQLFGDVFSGMESTGTTAPKARRAATLSHPRPSM